MAAGLFALHWCELLRLVRTQSWRSLGGGGGGPALTVAAREQGLFLVQLAYGLVLLVLGPTALWFASGLPVSSTPGAGASGYELAGVMVGLGLLTPAAMSMESQARAELGGGGSGDGTAAGAVAGLAVRLHWISRVNLWEQLLWDGVSAVVFVLSMAGVCPAAAEDMATFLLSFAMHAQFCVFFSTVGMPKGAGQAVDIAVHGGGGGADQAFGALRTVLLDSSG
eukprot:SAG22_NODE_1554_length_4137_cov_3.159485_3_plen_224_part_00